MIDNDLVLPSWYLPRWYFGRPDTGAVSASHHTTSGVARTRTAVVAAVDQVVAARGPVGIVGSQEAGIVSSGAIPTVA